MNKNLKDQILNLRNEEKNYNEIKEILKCSKSTISYYCANEIKNLDISDNDKNLVISLRKKEKTYDEIKKETNISEDKIKIICREINLNKSLKFQKPTEDEIKKMQDYYDNVISNLKEVGKKFGWNRHTLSKYITTNKNKHDLLTKEEYKEKRKKI